MYVKTKMVQGVIQTTFLNHPAVTDTSLLFDLRTDQQQYHVNNHKPFAYARKPMRQRLRTDKKRYGCIQIYLDFSDPSFPHFRRIVLPDFRISNLC